MSKNQIRARMKSYREYMGPSANGMSDKSLMRLAGWVSFCAGWDAAIAHAINFHGLEV